MNSALLRFAVPVLLGKMPFLSIAGGGGTNKQTKNNTVFEVAYWKASERVQDLRMLFKANKSLKR